MVGVQHQAGVEDLSGTLRRPGAGQLQQEVGGSAEAGIGSWQLPAGAGGMIGGDQHRLLCGQPGRLTQVGRRVIGLGVRIVGAAERDQAAQRLHRLLVPGDASQVLSAASAPSCRPAASSAR